MPGVSIAVSSDNPVFVIDLISYQRSMPLKRVGLWRALIIGILATLFFFVDRLTVAMTKLAGMPSIDEGSRQAMWVAVLVLAIGIEVGCRAGTAWRSVNCDGALDALLVSPLGNSSIVRGRFCAAFIYVVTLHLATLIVLTLILWSLIANGHLKAFLTTLPLPIFSLGLALCSSVAPADERGAMLPRDNVLRWLLAFAMVGLSVSWWLFVNNVRHAPLDAVVITAIWMLIVASGASFCWYQFSITAVDRCRSMLGNSELIVRARALSCQPLLGYTLPLGVTLGVILLLIWCNQLRSMSGR
jgi:hypothetical protein